MSIGDEETVTERVRVKVKVERVPSSRDSGVDPQAAVASVGWPRAEPQGLPSVAPEWAPALQPEALGELLAAKTAAAGQRLSRRTPGGKLPLQNALLRLARCEGHVPDVGRPADIQNIDDIAVVRVFVTAQDNRLIRIELRDAG